jgi:hypothetical protein
MLETLLMGIPFVMKRCIPTSGTCIPGVNLVVGSGEFQVTLVAGNCRWFTHSECRWPAKAGSAYVLMP